MRCGRCQELLSPRLDGELSEKRTRAVDEHLAACRACAAAYGELRALCACFEELGPDAPPAPDALDAPDAIWARIEAGLDADGRRERARALWRRHAHLAPATVALLLGSGLVGGAAVRHAQALHRSASADRELLQQSRTALEHVEVTNLAVMGELRAMANADRAGWSETDRARRDEEFAGLERALDESRAAVRDEARPSLATGERLQADYRAEIAFFERALAPVSPEDNPAAQPEDRREDGER